MAYKPSASGSEQNPANAKEKGKKEVGRIPMSVPMLKLTAPEITGYHCHWMLGTASRLAQAQRAGYTFVEADEVDLNNFDLSGSEEDSGNTDLGTRVSIVAGAEVDATTGDAQRLYLMKLPIELWEQDQLAIEDRHEQIAATLRGEPQGENTYIPDSHKKNVASLFTRKK